MILTCKICSKEFIGKQKTQKYCTTKCAYQAMDEKRKNRYYCKKTSLSKKLLDYINSSEGWHKKVNLFVVADDWGYSPESVGRCLRTLAEDKQIQVSYYDGKYSKNLAKYSNLSTLETKQRVKYQEVVDSLGNRKVIQIIY